MNGDLTNLNERLILERRFFPDPDADGLSPFHLPSEELTPNQKPQQNTHTNMPLIDEMSESRFLKKEDLGAGKLLTMKDCVPENVARKGQPAENKWVLYFEEEEKGIVLNKINRELIAMITKQRDTDNWPGHKIVAFNDMSVMFEGKMGGIRVRAPKNKPAAAAKPVPALPVTDGPKPGDPDWTDDESDDGNSIPF